MYMYIKSLLCTPFKNGIVQHRIYTILICPSYLIIAGGGGGGTTALEQDAIQKQCHQEY